MKLQLTLFVSWAITITYVQSNEGEDCIWDKDVDYPDPPPLLYDPLLGKTILPTMVGEIRQVRLNYGDDVIVACPQSTVTLLGKEFVHGKCFGSKDLLVDGKSYDLKSLSCSSNLKENLMKRLEMGHCGENQSGVVHHIGFKITEEYFYDLILICFDHLSETAFYTYHVIRGQNIGASDKGPRPSFKSDKGLFTGNPNSYYNKDMQEELLSKLLGRDVIDETQSFFFVRGHLSPDADFAIHNEAEATYYYANVVPQWQSINNGNWKAIETSIRDLAEIHKTDFEIWTGLSEVLSMADVNNSNENIFLGLSDDTNPQSVVPAPSMMWKVVYEKSSKKGVAFVTLNDPYLSSIPTKICQDVCSQLTWVDNIDAAFAKGVSYCCSIADLKKAVPNVPDLGNVKLLTR